MTRRIAFALAGWIVAGIGWTLAVLAYHSLPTEDEWDARYLEGVADGEDAQAQRAGA